MADGVARVASIEVEAAPRWVEEARLDLGEGASASLARGLLFPVVDDRGAPAGFAFVGAVSATLPAAGAEGVLRAGVPDAALHDGAWTLGADLVVAFGRDPDLAAAARLGRPLVDDPGDVVYRDDDGHEVVLVTDLRPREALDRARDAVRRRALALAGAGLDPLALLTREALREGPPRSIVELAPTTDLGPLVAAVEPRADLGATWATWVVDPTGLVDEAWSGVLGVHGPVDGGRVWRALGGTAATAPPALAAEKATANVIVGSLAGVAITAEVEVALTARAAERTRWVDVWLPETPNLPRGGAVAVASDPEPVLTVGGVAATPVEAPFGPRTVPGASLRSYVLPAPLEPDAARSLRLAWRESWDVGRVIDPAAFAAWAWVETRSGLCLSSEGLPATDSLGAVATGLDVLPRLATGPARYPAELRLGSEQRGWSMVGAAGARALDQAAGTVWVVPEVAPAAVAVGRYDVARTPARDGFPALRVHRAGALPDDLLVAVRAVLHFYGDVLPPWPHAELVVAQGRSRPVVSALGDVRPEADPRYVTAGFAYRGGGVVDFEGLYVVAPYAVSVQGPCPPLTVDLEDPSLGASLIRPQPLPSAPKANGRAVDPAVRSLAEALAAGWWAERPWSDRDRWLPGALARFYRDRFVEEAWGPEVAARFDRDGDALVADTAPSAAPPLAGRGEAWAAERGARLLRVVRARIGEEATMRALHDLQVSPAPSLAALVAALEATGGVSFAGFFDAFAVVGLRPAVRVVVDGPTATFAADPPVGAWELPVDVGGRAAWVSMVDGAGTLAVPPGATVTVDPEHLLPLRRGP